MVTLWIVVRIHAFSVAIPVQHVSTTYNVCHARLGLISVTLSAFNVRLMNSSKETSAQTVGLIVFSVTRDQTNAKSVLPIVHFRVGHVFAKMVSLPIQMDCVNRVVAPVQPV